MAHSLRLNVIAEGVEHRSQLEQLVVEGCDEFQGFYCHRPLSEDDLMQFISDGVWTRADPLCQSIRAA